MLRVCSSLARLVCAAGAAALCAATATEARMVQFGVVAFPNQTVEVAVSGQTYRLAPPDMYAPYYWGNYDVPDTFTYKYIVDGADEPFDRGGPDTSRTRTYNDFYGRQQTVVELPRLPQPFGDSWTRSLGYTPLFDDSYIPTFHLAGDPVRINDVWTNMAQNNTAAVTMTVVLADYVLRFENVRYGISAAGRSNNFAKQAYRLKLDTGDDLFGVDEWKLRNGEEDPTQTRETTYCRVLEALACPVIRSTLVRLYVNKEPVGLFALQDDANQKSTIRTLFHGNQDAALQGDKGTGAIFEANSFTFGAEGGLVQYQLGDNPPTDPTGSLKKMISAVNAANDDAGLDALNNVLDLETLLRAHAMEFLTFHWDSSWLMGSNFMLYDDSKVSKKFFFSDEDFDQTFGIAVGAGEGTFPTAAQIPYSSFGTGNASVGKNIIMPKLLSSQKYGARFQDIVVTIVKHLFNPVVLGARFRALHERIAQDVEWDRATPRRQNGKPDLWKYEDFQKGLEGGTGQAEWGTVQWVQMRAESIASQYNFQWDQTPMTAPAPRVTPPPSKATSSTGNAKSGINKDTVPNVSLASTSRELCSVFFTRTFVVLSFASIWL